MICFSSQAEDNETRLQEEKADFGGRRGQRRRRIRARTHICLQVTPSRPHFYDKLVNM